LAVLQRTVGASSHDLLVTNRASAAGATHEEITTMSTHFETSTDHITTTDTTTTERRTRSRRGRFARLARILAVPAAALTFAAVQTPLPANAASSVVGSASASVGCLKSGNTEWMVIDGSAIQGSGYSSQYVTMRAGYYIGKTFYTLPWLSQPAIVSANQPMVDAYGHVMSVDGPQFILVSTTSRIANSSGVVTAYVQAGFWDGHTYEYTGWVAASTYGWNINGYNAATGPAPCRF
jgi:hypothetical protein